MVLVHYASSQYPITKFLQKEYGWMPVFIFHNCDLRLPNVVKKIIGISPRVGVRSEAIKKKITNIVGHEIQTFQVYSGYPDHLLNSYCPRICKSGNKTERYNLLFAGRLIPQKNVDIIIKALAQIKDEYPFVLNIVGDGEKKSELTHLVENIGLKERVVFHGNQSREYVLSMMQKTDCFIMASHNETLGLVYLEALGCGCFVIGSKGEGIDGIIHDKENGVLVTPGNVTELVDALEYYFNLDEKVFRKIMDSAHETALKYTESSVTKMYIHDALESIQR